MDIAQIVCTSFLLVLAMRAEAWIEVYSYMQTWWQNYVRGESADINIMGRKLSALHIECIAIYHMYVCDK